MFERIPDVVLYVGSAAVVAFLAVCLSAPRVATFACDTTDAQGTVRCELTETLAVDAGAPGGTSPAKPPADRPGAKSVPAPAAS